jgi:predicted transcriptional regulator
MVKMSQKRIINALEGLGLSNVDVEVYIFLANNGPHTERELVEKLKTKESKIHHSLKSLQNIEIVKTTREYPEEYYVLTFEQVIDLFIEVKKEQTKTIKDRKKELLSSWKTIAHRE